MHRSQQGNDTWRVNDEQSWQFEIALLPTLSQSLCALQQRVFRDVSGTNLLCDAASFPILHIGAPHIVQDLSLPCSSISHRVRVEALHFVRACMQSWPETSIAVAQKAVGTKLQLFKSTQVLNPEECVFTRYPPIYSATAQMAWSLGSFSLVQMHRTSYRAVNLMLGSQIAELTCCAEDCL